MRLAGWGRFPVVDTALHAPRDLEDLQALLATEPEVIARGNGRAYGDSAVNHRATISTRHFNRFEAFEPKTGQLIAGAGALLSDIIAAFLPRGWFPLVTPGSKFVTLGGVIAADVHGKNHHKDGSFRTCVDWVEVLGPDGQVRRASRQHERALFDYTLGGMGLTGIILRAAIRLRAVESGWLRQETIPVPDLAAAMAAFDAHGEATYSVAWIDGLARGRNLGRAIVMLGEHAAREELTGRRRRHPFEIPRRRGLRLPVTLPAFVLNALTVRAFNGLYYRAGQRKAGASLVDWDSYFYPLDAILGWNRIYGRRGFAQFQCVLPLESAEAGLRALLKATSAAGAGSFLSVLKRLGPGEGAVSFPMEGYTLALDFPISAANLRLLDRLDRITLEHGGRFYLAKDARMSPETLRASDDRIPDFIDHRHAQGWAGQFRSAQAERLSL